MKIYPEKRKLQEESEFAGLTPLERKTRYAALVLAFISVFAFFVKIIFL